MVRVFFERLRAADWFFGFAAFMLASFGLAAIYSVELSRGADDFSNLKKQGIAFFLAFSLFLVVMFSNYRLLRNYAALLYIVGIAMLIGVLFFGTTVRGTTGWFELGPFNFQPVEFMKVSLAVALATYFSERARKEIQLREILESGALALVPIALTFLQPDLGSATLLFGMWGILLLFAGLKVRHILSLVIIGLIGAIITWSLLLADYQQARILTFLNPELDPLGQGYNVTQAIIAVGAGGLFGRGLGFGSQSQLKFLPESQTDFIFAVIAEELGFIGITLLLAAFLLLFFRIQKHASETRDDFTSFLLLAIGGILFVQFSVNVGMNLGMLPVTGVTLPLVSYGGSSLLFTALMLGVVESVALRARTQI